MSRASNLAGFTTSISPPANLSVGIITASSVINVGTGLTLSSGGINITGVITATSFSGNGSGLTGAGIGTTGSINTSGIITASSFSGNGSGLTGVGLGTTGSINTSGIITATSFFGSGANLTGVAGTSVFAAGTAAAPSISPTGDSNTGIFFPSADTIAFAEGGAEAMRVDSSGRLLVGTTSSASDNIAGVGYANIVQILGAATGAGLKVGNTADFARINVVRSANVGTDVELGTISFGAEVTSVERARVSCFSETTGGSGGRGGRLMFFTAADGSATPTERMRITSEGYLKVSTNGSYVDANGNYHELDNNENTSALIVRATSATYDSIGGCLRVSITRNTTNGTFNAITYFNEGGTDIRFKVLDSGNVQNTNNSYGGISDIKLKENIVDATSQWDDIKALQVRKYNFKEETGNSTHTQIGLVAQEVELVSPGLVSESPDRETIEIPVLDSDGNQVLDQDGNPQVSTEERETGTVTKSVNYSVLYMKAVKALQEAIAKIESLEARLTAAGI